VIAYRQAGVFYRNLGIRLESSNPTGRAGADSEYWYRKSLNALLRSEKIELAQDEIHRAENARRGKPGLTFVPSALYLQMGQTYQKLGDPGTRAGSLRARAGAGIRTRTSGGTGVGVRRGRRYPKGRHGAGGSPGGRSQPHAAGVETGGLYSRIDPSGCAVSREGGTLGLNVDCPLVHGDICTASRNVAATYLAPGSMRRPPPYGERPFRNSAARPNC
jgi:hypothetical protein